MIVLCPEFLLFKLFTTFPVLCSYITYSEATGDSNKVIAEWMFVPSKSLNALRTVGQVDDQEIVFPHNSFFVTELVLVSIIIEYNEEDTSPMKYIQSSELDEIPLTSAGVLKPNHPKSIVVVSQIQILFSPEPKKLPAKYRVFPVLLSFICKVSPLIVKSVDV